MVVEAKLLFPLRANRPLPDLVSAPGAGNGAGYAQHIDIVHNVDIGVAG
jgi:hypothetical protein